MISDFHGTRRQVSGNSRLLGTRVGGIPISDANEASIRAHFHNATQQSRIINARSRNSQKLRVARTAPPNPESLIVDDRRLRSR
jgi:hypothetical protein